MRELAAFTPAVFDDMAGEAARTIGLKPAFLMIGGDAMAPTLREGDYAVIDRGALRFVSDGLWAIRFGDGRDRVRRLTSMGRLVLMQCDNRAYPDTWVDPGILRIYGRVVGAIKRL